MKALKKILFSLLSVCMAGSFAFAAACGGGDKDGSSDGGEDTCNHDDTIVCDDCGTVVQGDAYYVNFAESVVGTLGAAKGYKLDLTGTKVTLDYTESDEYFGTTWWCDENDSWFEQTLDKVTAAVNSGEAFIGFDENSALYATGDADLEIKYYTDAEKVFSNVTADASFTFEGTKLTAKLVNSETYVGLSTELQAINNYEDEELTFEFDLADLASMGGGSVEGGDANVGAEVMNNVEGDMEGGMGTSAMAAMFEVIPQIFTQYIPQVVTAYEETVVAELEAILADKDLNANAEIAKLIDGAFAVTKDGDNYKFTMDQMGAWLKGIDTLLHTKFSVLVNNMLGEGFYEALPTMLGAMADMKVSTILTMLEGQGITLDHIIAIGDMAVQEYTGDTTMTLDMMLAAMMEQEGFTVKGFVDSVKDKTVTEVLAIYNITLSDYIATISGTLDAFKDKTIFDYVIMYVQQMMGAEMTPDQIAAVKKQVTDTLAMYGDFLDEAVEVSFVMDKDGKLVSYFYGVEFDTTVEATNTVISSFLGTSVDVKVIVDVNFTITAAEYPVETPAN